MASPQLTEFKCNDYEIFPPEAVYGDNESCPTIQQLQVEGGIAEVLSTGNMTTGEFRVAALGATGVTDGQIAGTLPYSEKTIVDLHANALRKLYAVNQAHGVTQLFRHRYMRVIGPIGLPELEKNEEEVLQNVAEGRTLQQTSDAMVDMTVNSVKDTITSIKEKWETPSISRAVLLSYLGGVLVPDNSTDLSLDRSCSYRIWPGHAASAATNIDCVEWQEGVFAVHNETVLSPNEQLCFAISAVGLRQSEIAENTGTTRHSVRHHILHCYKKLQAHNVSSAVTQALLTKNIYITREVEPIGLSRLERLMLLSAAAGLSSKQSQPVLHKCPSEIRNISSELQKKMGVRTLGGAVMKAYLSREIDLRDVINISAAFQPSSLR